MTGHQVAERPSSCRDTVAIITASASSDLEEFTESQDGVPESPTRHKVLKRKIHYEIYEWSVM